MWILMAFNAVQDVGVSTSRNGMCYELQLDCKHWGFEGIQYDQKRRRKYLSFVQGPLDLAGPGVAADPVDPPGRRTMRRPRKLA